MTEQKLLDEIQALRVKLFNKEEKLNELRAQKRNLVEFSRKGDTFTLKYNGRTLKVTKNVRNRLRVKENGRTVDGDYTWGMHRLKLELVNGTI